MKPALLPNADIQAFRKWLGYVNYVELNDVCKCSIKTVKPVENNL